MPSFAEQVHVKVAHSRQIPVRVVLNEGLAVLIGGGHTVVRHTPAVTRFDCGDGRAEDAVVLMLGGMTDPLAALLGDDVDAGCQRTQDPHGHGALVILCEMPAEHLMGVVIACVADGVQCSLIYSKHDDISIDSLVFVVVIL